MIDTAMMLRNYLTVAFRHFATQKLHAAINVLGLAVGLACFILIGLFVRHERSYDRQYANADRIYRVSRDFFATEHSSETHLATMAAPAAALLREDFPEIEHVARIACCGANIGTGDGAVRSEPGFAEADNDLFSIFDFVWLRGDPNTALSRPYTLVLTHSAARRYFRDDDPVGRTLLYENRWPLQVTGVIEDLGASTHLRFTMLASLSTMAAIYGAESLESWNANRYLTYVLLRDGASADGIRRGSAAFFERHFQQGSSRFTGFSVTPLTDIHLHSHREEEMTPAGSAGMVHTFSAIAVFVLLVACINFMNLATAQGAQRAKEIAVRKATGATRLHIALQFLAESSAMAAVSVVLAVALVEVALPAFNAYMGLDLEFDYLRDLSIVPSLAVLALVTGVVAGSYPAFYLSAFTPARVLKGDVARGGGAAALRRGLVILQFSIAIALMIATAVVYRQMKFAENLDLGFDKDRIVVVDGSPTEGFGGRWAALKRAWLANPNITDVTASMLVPSMQNSNAIGLRAEGGASPALPFLWVDYGFFEAYRIPVVAGRTFSEEHGDAMTPPSPANERGKGAYILNETAARRFGWTPAEAIGKQLALGVSPGMPGPVVGVVKDVYLESVRSAIKPMVYMVPPAGDVLGYVPLMHASLRIRGGDVEGTLAYIDATWREILPNQDISRHFLDVDFDALYRSEQRQGTLFSLFAGLAILIACLGLFGLASFMTERRTKEIGIRKAIGGGVGHVVGLFTAEFAKLVLLANLIAWPSAYFLVERWLERFAYRIDMSPTVYVGSALAALAIAAGTVAAVAARAASVRPARALRYE